MAATEEVPKRHDYSRTFQGAEEAASLAIDQILAEGGTILWRKYLERKAFVFAENSATEAAVSHLEMCFVAHDEGEEAMDENWNIEEEPMPLEIDSWARMHLPTRQLVAIGEDNLQAEQLNRNPQRKNTLKKRLDLEKRSRPVQPKTQQRMFPLPDESHIEEEEENLRRHKKEQREAQIQCDLQAQQVAKDDKAREVELNRMHEEMDRRPHTFDSNGAIIWIEEPKPERLPKVQESVPFTVPRSNARRTMDAGQIQNALNSSQEPRGQAQGQEASNKSKRRPRDAGARKHQNPDFTDFFARLQDGQPPILETMVVRPGVILEAQGQMAVGPQVPDQKRTMSRKEYVQHAERELAGDGGASAGAGIGGKGPPVSGGDSPRSGAAVGPGGGIADDNAGGAGVGQGDLSSNAGAGPAVAGGLPAIPAGRSGPGAMGALGGARQGGAGAGGMRNPEGTGMQSVGGNKLQGIMPTATPRSRMRSQYEATGNPRPPRYHQPTLGGPWSSAGAAQHRMECSPGVIAVLRSSAGTAQPPIGATMGHGLVHSGSLKESFFYPPQTPVLPPALLKAASEGMLRRETSIGNGDTPKASPKGRYPPKDSSRGASRGGDSEPDIGGAIKGDRKNQVYRNVLSSMGGF